MKLEELEAILQSYVEQHKVGKIAASGRVEQLLQYGGDDIRRMSDEECGEAAWELRRHAAYIQSVINHEKAVINWATRNIDLKIAKRIEQYSGQYASFEQKKLQAINDNDVTRNLYILRTYAENRVSKLEYLPGQLSGLAETMLQQQQQKRRNR
jgi:hypothetical protein